MTVRQFGGGKANLTYLLRFAESLEYVLRRPPLGNPMRRLHMTWGARIVCCPSCTRLFPSRPRVYHYCEDETDHWRSFSHHGALPRCRGRARSRCQSDSLTMPAAPQLMSKALVDTLAAFHAVDLRGAWFVPSWPAGGLCQAASRRLVAALGRGYGLATIRK